MSSLELRLWDVVVDAGDRTGKGLYIWVVWAFNFLLLLPFTSEFRGPSEWTGGGSFFLLVFVLVSLAS